MTIRSLVSLITLTTFLVCSAGIVNAQGKKSDAVVKAKVAAEKVADNGTQVVNITLSVDSGYHIYANPVNNPDFESNQTTVSSGEKAKVQVVKVEYPKGETVKDKTVGDYNIYKGKVTLKATIKRAGGGSGPVKLAIRVQACDKSSCLFPGTLMISVP